MRRIVVLMLVLCVGFSSLFAQRPRLFLMNADTLLRIQAAVFKGDKRYVPSVKRLVKDADKALALSIPTVMEKEILPPSGDKHDFYSLSRYWWPDPNKPDGLPYIRKDGEVNPEILKITDHENLQKFLSTVPTLALAFFYTADEKYAEGAMQWIRAWYVDPATRMNPNMRFSQQVRGRDIERGTGILDGREVANVIDAIGILRLSRSWTKSDDDSIMSWFRQYKDWLVNSPNGKSESNAKNNHGSWYDAHTTAVALFVGDTATARRICEEAKKKRIAYQFEPNGRQEEELVRTLSWHYCQFNLTALFRLSTLAEKVGVDLWRYRTEDGRSMRGGLDFMVPFIDKQSEWPEKQIKDFDMDMLALLGRKAAEVYNDPMYLEVWNRLSSEKVQSRTLLQYGSPALVK